jgi:hypothetical protein
MTVPVGVPAGAINPQVAGLGHTLPVAGSGCGFNINLAGTGL